MGSPSRLYCAALPLERASHPGFFLSRKHCASDFSPDHELSADETKLAYDELRVTFFETQGVLATEVDTYNRDASEFNETCNN